MRVVPSILIPEPVNLMSPVSPPRDSTPVLVMMGFLIVPETFIPSPGNIFSIRFDAVSMPFISTSLLN